MTKKKINIIFKSGCKLLHVISVFKLKLSCKLVNFVMFPATFSPISDIRYSGQQGEYCGGILQQRGRKLTRNTYREI